jgi:hypothetical protein
MVAIGPADPQPPTARGAHADALHARDRGGDHARRTAGPCRPSSLRPAPLCHSAQSATRGPRQAGWRPASNPGVLRDRPGPRRAPFRRDRSAGTGRQTGAELRASLGPRAHAGHGARAGARCPAMEVASICTPQFPPYTGLDAGRPVDTMPTRPADRRWPRQALDVLAAALRQSPASPCRCLRHRGAPCRRDSIAGTGRRHIHKPNPRGSAARPSSWGKWRSSGASPGLGAELRGHLGRQADAGNGARAGARR